MASGWTQVLSEEEDRLALKQALKQSSDWRARERAKILAAARPVVAMSRGGPGGALAHLHRGSDLAALAPRGQGLA